MLNVDFCDDSADSLDFVEPSARRVAVTIRQTPTPLALAQLTDGQRDCLRLVYGHMTSKDIARVLGVSPHTVDMRLRTAMRVLAVGSRIEAARLLMYEDSANGVGFDHPPEAYQPLIYHAPDVAPGPDTPILVSPASNGSDDSAQHNLNARFSPVVGPPANGPPRMAGASPFATQHPASWSGATVVDPGLGTRPLSGSLPWGKRNDLGIGARLAWIALIAIGSALGFGAVLGALAALKTLL